MSVDKVTRQRGAASDLSDTSDKSDRSDNPHSAIRNLFTLRA